MSRFEPIGEEARWRVVYRLLAVAPIETVVSYELLGEALSLHPLRERKQIQAAVRRAAADLLENECRALRVAIDQGYRVVDASGQLELSRRHQAKSMRHMERSYDIAVHVDLNGVNEAVRRRLELQAEVTSAQLEYNRRMERRVRELETAVASAARKPPEPET